MQRILGLMIFSFLIVACSKESIRGSGSTLTESRTVPAFTGVRIEGSGKAIISQGTQQKVEVKGYQNLLSVYQTMVQNGVLVMKFKDDLNVQNSNIEVSITVAEISYASINGSGEISLSNFNGNSIEVEINGSGDIFATNNVYTTSRLLINGSGYIHGRQIQAKRTVARITGSGKIDAFCNEKIEAVIQGSGEINYWGLPAEVDTQISGNGTIQRKQ